MSEHYTELVLRAIYRANGAEKTRLSYIASVTYSVSDSLITVRKDVFEKRMTALEGGAAAVATGESVSIFLLICLHTACLCHPTIILSLPCRNFSSSLMVLSMIHVGLTRHIYTSLGTFRAILNHRVPRASGAEHRSVVSCIPFLRIRRSKNLPSSYLYGGVSEIGLICI
jgi:hypothetical protein